MPPGLSFTQFQSYPESHAINFVSQFRTNHNYELHHRPIIGFNHHQSNHYLSNSSNFISPISKELTVLTPVVQNKVDVLNVLQPVENEVFKNKIFEENESRANRRNKRKLGLLKKIEEFDILTGSSSIFISSGYNAFKTKVISYATKKS
jgi:hypothetical protein